MSRVICDICGGPAPHNVDGCRTHLLARVRDVQRRAALLSQPKEDESEVERFVRERGTAPYSARATGRSVANRVTEPITLEHFLQTVEAGRCLGCSAKIRTVRMPNAGRFWVCAADDIKGCGWSIGWRAASGTGQQVRAA